MIQLYIKDQLVDITESVGLYLNKKFEDTQNPTLYFADYSKTITLPMTANNKKIFDNFNRQDSVVTTESIDPRKQIPFKLFYNSNLVMEGYMKINNANTIISDQKYECELFSAFGQIMNEISEITFNKYEVQSGGGDKDDKYLIQSPWMNEFEVDRNLVRDSFEQYAHNMNGNNILDYIKFIPSYQGKYPDFQSDKEEAPYAGHIDELSRERDEHYIREFRSYYQQPAIWVEKLWKMAKNKVEEITDYEFVLDSSWFNGYNPYWTQLIYTCPSLFAEDENFVETQTNFNADSLNYHCHITTQSNLSSHHSKRLYFNPKGSSLYSSNDIFNKDLKGQTAFIWTGKVQFCCPVYTNMYAKIREDNPMYVKFYAVNANTNQVIPYASHTYMFYSCDYNDDISSSTFDDKYDVGVFDWKLNNSEKPSGYTNTSGWWFQKDINFTLNITQNVPYYIACDCYFANNGCGIEVNSASWAPRWDWMWTDKFYEGSGYHIFANMSACVVKLSDYKRSHTKIDMYRVFPKDTTLLKVLLNYSKMFGLLWDIDQDNKKITVMSRNKFFSGYEVWDWSKKVDRSRDFRLEPLCFESKYVNFNVEEGSGGRYEKYFSKFGNGYGAKKIDTEYQFNKDTEDLFEGIQPSMVCSKAQFSRMTNTENPDADPRYAPFMGYNYKIKPNEHFVENDDDGDNAGNFGAFYFCNGRMSVDGRLGWVNTSGYSVVFIGDDTDYQMTHGEFMWNLTGTYEVQCRYFPDINTVSNSNWSIHFNAPKEYYFEKPNGEIKYVYDNFWKNFINERYNVQNKKLTAYFYLTPEDYAKINFRQFVKIENTLYHINKVIDYDFDTNSPTKIELVQVWDMSAYTDGQHAWPDLSVTPDTLEVSFHEYKDVEVFSSHPWSVVEKPTWITYQIDTTNHNILHLKGNSDPLRSRTGFVKIRSQYSFFGIHPEELITVTQRPYNTYLNMNSTTATADRNGDTITVNIDSRPSEVSVLSKPSWCSVELRTQTTYPVLPFEMEVEKQPIGTVQLKSAKRITIDPVPRLRINGVTTTVATISVNRNNGFNTRTGTVRFTNGNVTKNFTIKQLGNNVVPYHFDDEIIHLAIDEVGTWNTRIGKEIDTSSVKITRGTVSKTSNTDIDNISISFAPQLLESQDMTETICTGGQVTFKTLEGDTITANYNVGQWLKNYDVVIGPFENGKVTVNGVDYNSTYFEQLPTGTTLTVVATPDDGSTFEGWSDGVQSASRTLTVASSRIEIYPIFKSDYYNYDNSDITDFDDTEHIVYK